MIGRRSRCYISSFVEIDPPVPEKKIIEGFLPYMGMGAILDHVTIIMFTDFHFPVPTTYIVIVSENPLFSRFPIEMPM